MGSTRTKIAFHYFFILIYLETIYKTFVFSVSDIFVWETLIMLIFLAVIAFLLSIISKLFSAKVNFVTTIFIIFLLSFWFSIDLVFVKVYNTYFSISSLALIDQVLNMASTAGYKIVSNLVGIILMFLPFVYTIFLRFKLNLNKEKINWFIKMFILTIFTSVLFYFSLYLTRNQAEMYSLFYKVDNNALNHEKGGVLIATYIDIKRSLFGFDEEVVIIPEIPNKEVKPEKPEKPEIIEKTYLPNVLDINFSELISNNNTIKKMNEYYSNETGTLKNQYTGYYKGKNLIFLTAESFNEIGVSEELTPTLYKLVNEGFVFENFYTPINLSTIGGEFQVLTGQFAHQNVLNEKWKKAQIETPYGIAHLFKNLDYKTYAFHNGEYYFQGRNKYLKILGFDNYLGCGNGLEKTINCNPWPRSDIEMIEKTTSKYLTNDDAPFMSYYMTNSGHFPYQTSGVMYRKYKEEVKDLQYSGKVKAYLASSIELDKALEKLIIDLTTANKLDDTVIVMVADHYPYDLSLSEINEISTYARDEKIEVNRSNLIIWNNKTPITKINKVTNQLDVMPTVYNLFDLKYDSRLFTGKDALSTEPGLVFFTNRSWVSDLGTYNSQTGIFSPKEGIEIPENYIKNTNAIVANRVNMSKLIIEQNYYKYLGGK